ncbi:unnamed protein product [Closterium sp. NIES-53]
MRSAFKCYKLLKLAMGEEKMPKEGDARDRWIEKSAVLYDLFLQSVNNDMFQHIKDLVELDDSGPKAWKLLRDVIQPNTLPMVIVLEKELAALSMRPGDDVKPVLDKIKDTYARMAAVGSNVSQMQQTSGDLNGYGNRFCRRTSAGATREVVLTTKLLRGMELWEAAEEEGEGEAECFSRPEGWTPPGMKPPSGERARAGDVQGLGAQGDGAHGKADPGMFLMVEDVKGSEGDVGSVGKVVMHPLTHWVIDSGCTSHMTSRAHLLDKVKPPGKIKFVAAASGALLPVIGVGNAKKSKAKVTFGPTSCRAKLGNLQLWDLEEKSSCIKDLRQLPIIPWNRKLPATAAAAATTKATLEGEKTVPTDGALDSVKKVLQPQQPHGALTLLGLTTSCEAEIYAGVMAAQELRWLTYLMTDLGERPRSPPVLYVDNKAMLALCHEQRLEHRMKHVALHYFLACELQQRRQLRLSYVASQANTADVFTKALGSGDHQRFCSALGLVPTLPHLLVA